MNSDMLYIDMQDDSIQSNPLAECDAGLYVTAFYISIIIMWYDLIGDFAGIQEIQPELSKHIKYNDK